jgi:small basic protein
MLAFYNFAYVGATSASPVLDMVSVGVGTTLWLILPLSMAVAILRYRLWDIDALINRTLVYGSLTISLAALYIGTVIGLQATFRAISGQQSDLAVAIATLVVAGVFNPWRRRLRAFIDQRFYRSQYDAGRVLADFQSRLRDEVDLDRLTGDLMAVAVTTVQPASVSLWLRSTGDST